MSHTNFSHKLEPFAMNENQNASPIFQVMSVHGPGVSMCFVVTRERMAHIAAFLFKEVVEAEVEYQESLKAKQPV